ncbi:pyridoxamine 5'-phosphate oxidase family protein [Rubrimonas cliftonensis]|uniref:Ferredoxin-NADP reductase n=1 Tax=Rubrimonas cliftonensis TaxID=89524 RepID=A0A1H4EJP1_9RHOB|nr:pyridoxamine 5'-phosphate oxidase family protein [Rubrimonas cliftonensis]SEA85253.1 hypothetical protein SAMN05444370_11457 [Rubrimonas cliftonensis]
MTAPDGWRLETTPFHAGEIAAQERVGVAEQVAGFARKAVRPYLTQELRDFYEGLPLVFVGHVDPRGRPWASVLAGGDGFIASPDETTLVIDARPAAGDPLAEGLVAGAPLGLVGVGIGNRRRNRVNGRVASVGAGGVRLAVEQAFGNCPQYIRPRRNDAVAPSRGAGPAAEALTGLDDRARALIARSESFFVASHSRGADPGAMTDGADVSHRGGKPGFVRVEGDVLTVPDFAGNLHFNTLGNLLLEPRAGLLFVDWETGEALMLTGAVEIVWDGPEVEAFRGAERLWRFTAEAGIRLPAAVAPGWRSGEPSPNVRLTGDWEEAAATLAAEATRRAWRPYRVSGVADESSVIRSFHLEPADGGGLLRARAGQHLTVRAPAEPGGAAIVRTYTLSSAPSDPCYRISVKREDARGDAPAGVFSTWLHAALKEGDVIEARAPAGGFALDTAARRPAVLIAAGVGVTPMVAMAREVANEGLRTRHVRPLTVIHAARSATERAFADEFRRLETATDGRIRYVSVLGRAEPGDVFDAEGRIDAALLRSLLALDDYDYFLCGPPRFMQAQYAALRSLGARDARIFAEAFGPAALERTPDDGAAAQAPVAEADEAVVVFADSGLEQRWSAGDPPLLDLAERHGLQPEYGCRNGACGACAVPLRAGRVAYRTQPSVHVPEGEALICCAVPAAGADRIELGL